MKIFLSVLLLATGSLTAPGKYEPIGLFYHENIGIPEAARIKAAEEAADFDGSRISGGSQSNLGQFPHMGGLLITTANGAITACGSALISNTRLTTAAHCWWDGHTIAHRIVVVLGSIRLFSGGTRITTNRIDIHRNYNPWTLNNDVAVLTINHVNFNNNIKSIALASGNNQFAGQIARAAGFGRTDDNVGINPNQVLSHVSLRIITNSQCARVYGTVTVIASTLCTSGANGRSTCGGDSGGALVLGNRMVGITSFGALAGCQRGFPAGFVRVTSFHNWIRQRM